MNDSIGSGIDTPFGLRLEGFKYFSKSQTTVANQIEQGGGDIQLKQTEISLYMYLTSPNPKESTGKSHCARKGTKN